MTTTPCDSTVKELSACRRALFLLVGTSVAVWVAAAAGALASGLLRAGLCPGASGDDLPQEVAQVMGRLGLKSSLLPSGGEPATQALAQTLR